MSSSTSSSSIESKTVMLQQHQQQQHQHQTTKDTNDQKQTNTKKDVASITTTTTATTVTDDNSQNNDEFCNDRLPFLRVFQQVFQAWERWMFPPSPLLDLSLSSTIKTTTTITTVQTVRGGVLLHGCSTPAEHYAKVRHVVQALQENGQYGAQGLQTAGLEYRLVPCAEHNNSNDIPILDNNQFHAKPIDYPTTTTTATTQSEEQDNINIDTAATTDRIVITNGTTLSVDLNQLSSKKHRDNTTHDDDCDRPSLAFDALSTDDTTSGAWSTGSVKDDLSEVGQIIQEQQQQLDKNDLNSNNNKNNNNNNNNNPCATTAALHHQGYSCHECMHRLFHIETNTLVQADNRKLFIADGDMYECIANKCQEFAHELMMSRHYNLQWKTVVVPNNNNNNSDTNQQQSFSSSIRSTTRTPTPVRVLVNKEHPIANPVDTRRHDRDDDDHDVGHDDDELSTSSAVADTATTTCSDDVWDDRPTLFIVTGRGKVRAGIFSRQHLMTSGLELATALPLLQESRRRRINVLLVDPNVHGDSYGFPTFCTTMDYFRTFNENSKNNNNNHTQSPSLQQQQQQQQQQIEPDAFRRLYFISHSASGGYLARYLLDHHNSGTCCTGGGGGFLDKIQAIAFTDSTHNVQWAKSRGNLALYELLQDQRCIYFRCAQLPRDCGDTDSRWYLHRAGESVPTDPFWTHRFGTIQTVWAGTNEHSLTNWYAHDKIWEHLDKYLD